MNIDTSLLAAEIPSLDSVPDFNPTGESAFIESGEATTDFFSNDFFTNSIPSWIEYLIVFGAGAAVLMIVLAGLMLMYGPQEEEYKTKGIQTLVWAVAGLIISVLSFTIVEIVNLLDFDGSAPSNKLDIDEKAAGIENLANGELITNLLPQLILLITQIIGVFALCLALYAGVLMVIRNGDEENVTKAKKLIIWGVVGASISFLAYMIVNAVILLNFESPKI